MQLGTDDILVALVYAINKAAEAEQALVKVMQEQEKPDAEQS